MSKLLAPDALLHVRRRDDHRLVVRLGGVLIESRGGLRPQVAVLNIEVDGADAVCASHAGELHAALDPLRGVISHSFIVALTLGKAAAPWSGSEGNTPSFRQEFKGRIAFGERRESFQR